MKIYSWNIWFRNKEVQEMWDFIEGSEADIFCLQEVTEELLTKLKELPCAIAYAIDVERRWPRDEWHKNYVVILSKYPILAQGEIPFPDYWQQLPLRTRFFVGLMHPFGFSRIRGRNGVWADLDIAGVRTRVFCLHLVLAHPSWRLAEFERAMIAHDLAFPTIVCGDFNILESSRVSVLNWLFAGRLQDAFFAKQERAVIEKRFASHQFTNVLRRSITHPLSQSQLDHILISAHFKLLDARVLSNSFGSDHHPIVAEIVPAIARVA